MGVKMAPIFSWLKNLLPFNFWFRTEIDLLNLLVGDFDNRAIFGMLNFLCQISLSRRGFFANNYQNARSLKQGGLNCISRFGITFRNVSNVLTKQTFRICSDLLSI